MNILLFIAFLKIQRFVSLKTELKTLAAYHAGHGWNSTNYYCLEFLFPLEQEFSTLAAHRITWGNFLKDANPWAVSWTDRSAFWGWWGWYVIGQGLGFSVFCPSGDTEMQPGLRTTAWAFHFEGSPQSFSLPWKKKDASPWFLTYVFYLLWTIKVLRWNEKHLV